jgi:hypothetical protein
MLFQVLHHKKLLFFVEKLTTPVHFVRNLFRDMNNISPIGTLLTMFYVENSSANKCERPTASIETGQEESLILILYVVQT